MWLAPHHFKAAHKIEYEYGWSSLHLWQLQSFSIHQQFDEAWQVHDLFKPFRCRCLICWFFWANAWCICMIERYWNGVFSYAPSREQCQMPMTMLWLCNKLHNTHGSGESESGVKQATSVQSSKMSEIELLVMQMDQGRVQEMCKPNGYDPRQNDTDLVCNFFNFLVCSTIFEPLGSKTASCSPRLASICLWEIKDVLATSARVLLWFTSCIKMIY